MKLQKPKGTQDILPADSAKWQYVENVARETFKKYNYGEIRTPMFEHYEVISRSVGDTTDIVTKEMYDFHDKGDRPQIDLPSFSVITDIITLFYHNLYSFWEMVEDFST